MFSRVKRWFKDIIEDGTTWGGGAMLAILLGTDISSGNEVIDAVLVLVAFVRMVLVSKSAKSKDPDG